MSRPAERSLLGAESTLDLRTSRLHTIATSVYTGLIFRRSAYLGSVLAVLTLRNFPPPVTHLRDFPCHWQGGAYLEKEQTRGEGAYSEWVASWTFTVVCLHTNVASVRPKLNPISRSIFTEP